jgi:nucleotide-binding universal stress UspA family protein
MTTFLIVAYQTAGGQSLRDVIDDVSAKNADADFRLVVPATRTQHLFTWTAGESEAVARATAEKVAEHLRSTGVRLRDVTVGDPDPVLAVADELTARPDCDAIIVSTFPPGVSRWLRSDLPTRLEKITGLPVTHVIVEPEQST